MADFPAAPVSMTEDDANSGFSNDEGGSSGEDTTQGSGGTGGPTGKKRKRVKYQKTSCELCKARKVKCDRAEPACSWCARHNRTCVYLERQKPGSRIGFTLELESKVNRVDALLQTLWRRVEDHIANDHGPQGQSQTLSPAVSNLSHAHLDGFQPRDAARGASSAPAAGGVSQQRGVTFSSPSWQQNDASDSRQPAGASVTSTPTQGIISGGNGSFTPPAAPRVSGLRAGSSSLTGGTDLPPQDMVYTLVDLYFKHCNTWCPILDRKTTFSIFFGSTSLNEIDRILLQAIVATTLRFLNDSRLSPEMRAHYHAVSRHAVMIYAMEHVSVDALRALVILALDELGTSNGPRGWNILSMLAQNVKQLDLCSENKLYLSAEPNDIPRTGSIRRVAVPRPVSWIEDEGSRRLCWMIYLLDRYATIATTSFDFMLEDEKMERVLPCSYDLFSRNIPVETRSLLPTTDENGSISYAVDKPENLGSFSYHCEILRIISKVHNFLKSPLDITSSTDVASWQKEYRSLDSALDTWLQSLPSEYSKISSLCHSDPASRVANWFMLHSAYVTAVVRLHSSAAYPAVRSQHFVPSNYAMQRCLSAVQSLRDITQDVYEANGLDLVGPPFAFSLWTAARVLIAHATAMGTQVDPKIDFFIDILSYVGQYWDVANNYAKILSRVIQKGRQGVVAFGAMRAKAAELVTLATETRRSGLDEALSRNVSLGDLDSIDVFDFFQYPRLPASLANQEAAVARAQGISTAGSSQNGYGTVPDPGSDWLGY